jgi:hypothetical protein
MLLAQCRHNVRYVAHPPRNPASKGLIPRRVPFSNLQGT